MKISKIYAQEVLDSRGNPTVQTTLTLENGLSGSAMVPSGASTGTYEAVELRDGDPERYNSKGVLKAVEHVNTKIFNAIKGIDVTKQKELDEKMIELDGTPNKSALGANAILSVSMAATRAAALAKNIPLYQHIAELFGEDTSEYLMPTPVMNLLNGGKHAHASSDFQEFMIKPSSATTLQEAVRVGAEVFHTLKTVTAKDGFQTLVGDEGGFAPNLASNEKPFMLLIEAIEKSNYIPGKDVFLGIDAAASEFCNEKKIYDCKAEGVKRTVDQMLNLYIELANTYPINFYEDIFNEDDFESFTKITEELGDKIDIIGDDLFVTNVDRLKKGIEQKAGNAILIKVNQIGTVSETFDAMHMAKDANFRTYVSHRSGETEDTFIADLAVGTRAGVIKTGSLSRSERVAKYNRLMMIERELGSKAKYTGE